jgi:hypothetical protein
LPLITEPLSSKVINLENIGADGKTFWTGPDIESFGTNPKLNDLFIGSKGMLGIPLNIKVKL